MYIPDQIITDKQILEETLLEFDAYSCFLTDEMNFIWQPVFKSFSPQYEAESDSQIAAMNSALAEKLMNHFQSFEVENYQLFGISNGQKVKLSWIED